MFITEFKAETLIYGEITFEFSIFPPFCDSALLDNIRGSSGLSVISPLTS